MQSNQPTRVIKLKHSGIEVEHYEYLKARQLKEMNKNKNEDDISDYAMKNFVVRIGEEKDNTKFIEIIDDLRVSDFKQIENALVDIIKEDLTDQKKTQ